MNRQQVISDPQHMGSTSRISLAMIGPGARATIPTNTTTAATVHSCTSMENVGIRSATENLARVIGLSPEPHETSLLLLIILCFLGRSPIQRITLCKSVADQNRWCEDGSIKRTSAQEAGIATQVISLLSVPDTVDLALRELSRRSAVQEHCLPHGPPSFTVDETIRSKIVTSLSPSLQAWFRNQALLLMTNGFPRPILDPE